MNEADVQETSAKSQTAVEESKVGVTLVKAFPPAVYAVPDELVISLEEEYAVVLAPKVAELVYNAMSKVFPVEAVKLCSASKISCLKLLQIADVIAILIS